MAVLSAEDARAPTVEELGTLVTATRSGDAFVTRAAIRALGRLERRDVVPHLLPLLYAAGTRVTAASAIAQAMRGTPLPPDGGPSQAETVVAALLTAARNEPSPGGVATIAHSLARLPCENRDQVMRIEAMLLSMLDLSKALTVRPRRPADAAVVMLGALRALEILPRVQRTLHVPSEATVDSLRGYASGTASAGWAGITDDLRYPAFLAAVSNRVVDEPTLRPNLSHSLESLRRAAVAALAGAASPITGPDRAGYIRPALGDRDASVRYEAVRGHARHVAKTEGCFPLVQMLSDRSEHVALAAIGALGESCAHDPDTLTVLISEARTPPNVGSWRRESHALVALARHSRKDVIVPLTSHSRHTRWQVRMYAARAAAIADDVTTLETLAFDADDNVREAALVPLKRLKGVEAETALVAALGRSDYQLVRTAARELNGITPNRTTAEALVDALIRISGEKRDTSRDTRVALLERLKTFGSDRYEERLRPLLKDFDPTIAALAAATLAGWTGGTHPVEPRLLPRPPLPSAEELRDLKDATITLVIEGGADIPLQLDVDNAPLNATRFARLAREKYFNGLTIHRIVPNFIVQGGSPGANEYMGDGPYVRDEISGRSHARGTIGLSTRGRDTGDAQFFINLIDNARLDFEYTVFGHVSPKALPHIDAIGEGARIIEVRVVVQDR